MVHGVDRVLMPPDTYYTLRGALRGVKELRQMVRGRSGAGRFGKGGRARSAAVWGQGGCGRKAATAGGARG